MQHCGPFFATNRLCHAKYFNNFVPFFHSSAKLDKNNSHIDDFTRLIMNAK